MATTTQCAVNELRLLESRLCIDGQHAEDGVQLLKCTFEAGTQEWRRFGSAKQQWFAPAVGKCLARGDVGLPILAICADNAAQWWDTVEVMQPF